MSSITILRKLIAALRLTLPRYGNSLKFAKKFTALALAYILIFAPAHAYGGVLQLLHFEWAYDTTIADLAGYKIYHESNPVVDVNDPNALTLDWEVLLETGTVNTFTMTAYDSSGTESSHSTPYTIEVPAEDENGNIPPVPVIKANVTAGEAPLTVDFDSSASYDFGGGIIVDHAWDFGDGDTANGSNTTHTYINGGNYTVWLVVTDDSGAASSAQTIITVSMPEGANVAPTAAVNAAPTTGEAPLAVNFDASASSDSDGAITLYSWDFGDGNSGSGQTSSHTYLSAGTYTATITVTDDDGAIDSAQRIITVTDPAPDNEAPTAIISANPQSGNAPLTVNFSGAGSTDSDGSIISFGWDFGDGDTGSGAAASHQFITGGTYTVLLTVTDDGGLSHQQQVIIAVNNAPTAVSTSITTNEDSAFTGTLTASDPDGNPLVYSIVANGTKGTAVITNPATGAFTYTPNTNATGADSFTFKANDGAADSNTATVSVTITAVNDLPAATDDTASTNEDTPATITVLANDTDADGDTLTVIAVTQGSNGSVTTNGTTVTYTPNADWNGTDSFTYTVSDGNGGSDTASVSVTVNVVNDVPVAVNANLSVNEDSTASGLLPASDSDGDSLTYSLVTNGTKGTAVITNTATGAFTYTTEANTTGADSFTFKVSDGTTDSNSATVSVTINDVNDKPTASDSSITTAEDTQVNNFLTATDIEGDALTYSIVVNGSKGTALITNPATGAFTYTPDPNTTGSDSFTFKVNDGNDDSSIATVTVTITAVNDAPVATDDTASTNEDTAATITVLANDTDTDGDALTVSAVSQGSNGVVTTNGTTVTYTPNADWNGADSFTYTVSDGNGGTHTATVSMTVIAGNDIPAAADDSAITAEDTAVMVNVLANDTDLDGDSLSVSAITQGGNGSVTTNGTTVAYTPNPGWNGTDSFTYTISDGNGGTDTASVNLTVTAVNDAPAANDASISVTEDSAATSSLSANDTEGDPLTYSIVLNGAKGTAVITNASTGAFTYTPNPNATGSDSFTFKANDGSTDSNPATLTITITTVNDIPVASDDTAATEEDTAVTISVLANDTDVDGDTLSISAVTQGVNGSVTNSGTTITYTPKSNWSGSDTFTYTVSDGNGGTDTATVHLTVNMVNDDPVAGNANITVAEDGSVSSTLTATDIEGNALTYSVISNGTKGTAIVTNASTGAFTYTPNPNATGTDSFTFKANDGQSDSNSATVAVTITAVNDSPTAADDSSSTNEGTSITISVLANDADVDGDTLTVSAVTQGSNGSVTSTGTAVSYTPNPGWSGSDSFTYTVSDGSGGTDTATVNMAVNAVPLATNASITAEEDTTITGSLSASDQDDLNLTYSIVSNGTLGTATLTDSTSGKFTYTPKANLSGTDSFSFRASDGKALSNSATVTVAILPVNDPPSAGDDFASTEMNRAVMINVLENDSDIDDEILRVTSVNPSSNGSVGFDDQKVIYTPGENFSGTDSFTYTVEDQKGAKTTAQVTVEVQGGSTSTPVKTDRKKERNYPPVASNSSVSTNEDTPLQGQVIATDPEGLELTYSVGTAPANGTVTLNPASGSYIYTPAANYAGQDRFTFSASDGKFQSKPGTIYILVKSVNDAPTATPDSVIIDSGTMVSINVLANDFDLDNDPLVITSVTQGSHGRTSLSVNKIIYIPEAGYSGQDEFTYLLSDYNRGTATGKVTVTLLPLNDKPLAVSSTFTVPQNLPTEITLAATDPENDPLTYNIVKQPTQGVLKSTDTPGTYLYEPKPGVSGSDSIVFTVSDGNSTSNEATATITIANIPVANAGGPYFGFVGTAVNFDAGGSISPDSQIVQYEWDWNDDGVFDEKVASPTVEHVWTTPYTGNVVLRVMDDLGITSTAGASLTVMVLGDQDGDNDFDNDDVTLFEKNYPIAQGNCLGDTNYSRVMDLNSDTCITQDDQSILLNLAP